jgi:hypothetical protein
LEATIMYEFLVRSAINLPSVEEAIRERRQARDDLDALIAATMPEIGEQAARVLSDAATDLVARVGVEVIARLFVLAGEIAGGPADALIGPEPEDNAA